MASTLSSNAKLAEQWSKDSQMARTHLRQILDWLDSEEESTLEWVTEALENCGPPLESDLSWLIEQLRSNSSDRVYWCATLLGRMGEAANLSQSEIAQVLDSTTVSAAAKSRAVWALGRIGSLGQEARSQLEKGARQKDDLRLAEMAQESLNRLR